MSEANETADKGLGGTRCSAARLTFRKAKLERFQQQRYEIVLGGKVVGNIQFTRNGGTRWYWYTLEWKEYRNTVSIEGSAIDLDGCKAECKQFFRQ